MTALFTPFVLKSVTLRNRIAVPPMCQYSALEGFATEWHLPHYTSLAKGGAGLVIVEATAVAPEGRITPGCLGLWQDAHTEGLRVIASAIKASGAVAGIQLAHAGRKASANEPWNGDDHIDQTDSRGWQTIGPSALPYGAHLPKIPAEMTLQDIERVQQNFVDAAIRAAEAGFQWLELHFAHGYLAQSFLSLHSNKRTDHYGGSLENRARFMLDTIDAVKAVWPTKLPLTVRLGVIEFDDNDEQTLSEAIKVVDIMKSKGVDLVSVSMNFVIPETNIPWNKPGFMAPIAARVRQECQLPVASSWSLDDAITADEVVAKEQMDLVMIGRAHLANPFYSYELACQLGVNDASSVLPTQYAHWLARYPRPAALTRAE